MTAEQNIERLLCLLRAAVVDKEMAAINAIEETIHKDGWTCDWNKAIADAQQNIDFLEREICHQ